MKIYILTNLIESEEDGAEVNVIGVEKTLKDIRKQMRIAIKEAKEMYKENEIEYEIDKIDDNTIVISTDVDERIEFNIFEKEI